MAVGLVTAVACGATAEPTSTPPSPPVDVVPTPVRVMTWNLQRGQVVAGRFGPADMAPFAARVTAARADIVGLQEVTREQATALSVLLGWASPVYVATKNPCPGVAAPLPAACVPFGNAILSRHPLAEVEQWILPASGLEAGVEERVLLRSVVDLDGRRVSVYVTHLASEATGREREAQARRILALVEDDRRAAADPFRPVLLGDFNAAPDTAAVAQVTEQFVDAWAELRGAEPGFTSNSALTLNRRIDYVFVGRASGLRPTEVIVDTDVLSDHLPVVAELS